MGEDLGDWQDYETGPFCRHWGSLGDCDDTCARCGHTCNLHLDGEPCDEPGCECPEWVEGE